MSQDNSLSPRRLAHAAPSLAVAACVCFYCLIAITNAVRLPAGSGPDEREHLQYVDVIARHWRLPLMPGAGDEQTEVLEAEQAQHPPLFYVVLAVSKVLTGGLISEADSGVALRLVCVLMGLAALVVVWTAGRLLWPDDSWRPAVAVCFFALLPQTQYMTSVVNNSNGALVLGAVVVLLCVCIVRSESVPLRDWLLLGVTVAALLCTKMTGLWVLPLCVLCAAAKMRTEASSRRRKVAAWLLLILPTIFLLGPWLARNQILYGTLSPERITTRRLPGGLSIVVSSPVLALEVMATEISLILLNFACPYWLVRSEHLSFAGLGLIVGLLLPAVLGLMLSLRRKAPGLKQWPWPLRDTYWIGVFLSMALSTLSAMGICLRDWGALIFLGRYVWEAAAAAALAWTCGMFALPWARARGILIPMSLAVMAAMSIWVCQRVLLFYYVHPPF